MPDKPLLLGFSSLKRARKDMLDAQVFKLLREALSLAFSFFAKRPMRLVKVAAWHARCVSK